MPADVTRLAFFLLVAGALLAWTALRRYRALRTIQDTARSKAASAPQGHVELQGVAWPSDDGSMQAPSGVDVVYHAMTIEKEETRGVGKNRRKVWVPVLRREHAPPFFLVDATGLVRVDPRGAELDLLSRRTRPWRAVPAAEQQRIVESTAAEPIPGFPPSGFLFGLFGSAYRVTESWIAVGSPLYAHGDFRSQDGKREEARATGLTRFHELVFDRTRREARPLRELLGRREGDAISAQEAIDGLGIAAASARANARTGRDAEAAFAVTGALASSPDRRLFLADRDEQHLVRGIGRSVYLPFGGGVAALAAALLLFFGRATPGGAPAVSAAGPAPGDHAALRSRCFGGDAGACSELLRRADELRVSASFREDYARRACALGRADACPAPPARTR